MHIPLVLSLMLASVVVAPVPGPSPTPVPQKYVAAMAAIQTCDDDIQNNDNTLAKNLALIAKDCEAAAIAVETVTTVEKVGDPALVGEFYDAGKLRLYVSAANKDLAEQSSDKPSPYTKKALAQIALAKVDFEKALELNKVAKIPQADEAINAALDIMGELADAINSPG